MNQQRSLYTVNTNVGFRKTCPKPKFWKSTSQPNVTNQVLMLRKTQTSFLICTVFMKFK